MIRKVWFWIQDYNWKYNYRISFTFRRFLEDAIKDLRYEVQKETK